MDPRLLRYYNQELRYLREMGGEFAKEFPKVAGRLGLESMEVADPYVERLIEGCAFLAARVQLKQDAEYPQLAQRLLEMIAPNLTSPVPSMLVARLRPGRDPNLINGFRVPRGSSLIGPATALSRTRCEFRTAQDVQLTPVRVTGAEYFLNAADLPLSTLPQRPRSGVRIRLELPAGMSFAQLKAGSLRFFLGGLADVALRLHELLLGATVGVLAGPPGRGSDAGRLFVEPDQVRAAGYGDDEAMLPVTLRGLAGTRLMQEYFAFPQRFLFVDVDGLGPAFAATPGPQCEVAILFDRYVASLEGAVEGDNFQLHCVPAINLFERRADRLHLDEGSSAYHLVPDRTAGLDYEVFDVATVRGLRDDGQEQVFLPLFAAPQDEPGSRDGAYWSALREPRLASEKRKREGPRSGYVGTEVFLSLVDARQTPHPGALRQLAVTMRCTNRDLPLFMPVGQAGGAELALSTSAPVEGIGVVAGPSRPQSAMREGPVAWRLLGLLSLNYLSLLDSSPEDGAVTLREILSVFAAGADPGLKRQIEGVRSIAVKPVVRRHPVPGPIAYGRGLEVRLTVDDLSFEGGSAALLASVLHRYFGRHVSMNSFVQTQLTSLGRGDVMRWAPRQGARAAL